MSITITRLSTSDNINAFVAFWNATATNIENHVNALEALVQPATSKLKLTNVASISANSIEAAGATFTGATGNLISVSPSGGASVFVVDVNGATTVQKVTATGAGVSNKSVLKTVDIDENAVLKGTTSFQGVVDFSHANVKKIDKLSTVSIVDANIGSGAATPIDLADKSIVLFDYDNSSSALTGSADVNLDTGNLTEGQELTIYCLRTNATGQKLYNGTSGNEIFAKIDPTAGLTSIAHTSQPSFAPTTSPNTLSFLRVRWTDIGSGTMRLLVLDSKLVDNVG